MVEDKKKEREQNYSLFQVVQQQLKQTQKQIKTLQSQQEDLLGNMQALDDLIKIKIGADILVPITSGIFIKATLQEKETVTVNIGAQTAVRKTIGGARQLLEEQFREVETVLTQLVNDFQELSAQAQLLEQRLAN